MKIRLLFLLSTSFLFIFLTRANYINADMAIPTVTTVFFTLNDEPYYGQVDYTVDCYGYEYSPWDDYTIADDNPQGNINPYIDENGLRNAPNVDYEPTIVYSYDASCSGYGCLIYEPYYFKFLHIDYCDIKGIAEGKDFYIEKAETMPYTSCNQRENTPFFNGITFVRPTTDYKFCLEKAGDYYDTSPCEKYLIRCVGVEATTEACTKNKGTHTINGINVAPDPQGKYNACIDQVGRLYDIEKEKCDVFLEEVPLEEIIFTNTCDVAINTCTLKAELPSNIEPFTGISVPSSQDKELCLQKQIDEYNKYLAQKTKLSLSSFNNQDNQSSQGLNNPQLTIDINEQSVSNYGKVLKGIAVAIVIIIPFTLIISIFIRKKRKLITSSDPSPLEDPANSSTKDDL